MPPKSVTLRQPEPVRAGELLQLACTATDSNPKTTLAWFRKDNLIPDGAGKIFFYLLAFLVYKYLWQNKCYLNYVLKKKYLFFLRFSSFSWEIS